MKLGKIIFKFNPGAAAARNATLLLTKMNAAGLAVRLYHAAKKKDSPAWKELSKFWDKIGGNPEILYHAIKQGMRVEYKHHPNRHKESAAVFNYEDFEPVSTATATATATPVLIKLLNIIKKFAAENPDTVKELKQLAGQGYKELAARKGAKTTTDAAGNTVVEIPESATPDMRGVEKAVRFEAQASGEKIGSSNNIYLIGGAIALIAIVYVSTHRNAHS